MARKFLNKDTYKENSFPFPDMDNTPEEEKDTPAYNKQMCEAVWGMYMNDKTAIGASMYDYYNLFRLYAQGRQPSSIYKTYFSQQSKGASMTLSRDDIDGSGVMGREQQLKGWMNVDFENIISFMPKLANVISGYFTDVDYDIKANNIDIDSGAEEEKKMYDYWARAFFLQYRNEVREKAGLPTDQMDYIPENKNELLVIKEEGGFKQPYVMDLEKLLKHTEEISSWSDLLKKKLLFDLKDLGCAFAHRFYNDETCKEEWGYIDPSDYIGQYSKFSDFRDSDFKGFRKSTTISELRRKGFKEEELSKLSKKIYGIYDNPSEAQWNKTSTRSGSTTGKNIGDLNIDVLWLYWIDVIDKKKIKYVTKSNETRYLDYNKTISERKENGKIRWETKRGTPYIERDDSEYIGKDEKVKNVRIRLVRHCKWIIGSDIVYDYGYQENQVRPQYNKPEIPIVGFMIPGRSMTDILTKPSDLFNLAAIRFENTLSRATEEGYAIDKSVLAAGNDGGKKYNVLKALQMHRETGYFIYSSMGSGLNRGGSPVPITKIPGTIGEGLVNSMSIMDRCLRFVEELTGLNPVTLGATPSPDSQVRTTQMSVQFSQTALKPYEEAIKSIKSQLANSSAEAIQLAIKNDPKSRKNYSHIIGEEGVERINQAKKLHVQYGIKMVARPTSQQRQELVANINLAYQKKQQGLPGLNEAQKAQLILEMDNGANLYHIMYKMSDWIRRDEKKLQQERDRAILLQGDQNKQLKEIEGKNSIELERQKTKNKVLESNLEFQKEKTLKNIDLRNEIYKILSEKDVEFINYLKQSYIDKVIPSEEMQQAG